MTKFASLKKIHTKIIILKRNLELNNLEFLYYSTKAYLEYTFPEFIFRNHMSHENEAILRKSISDERK